MSPAPETNSLWEAVKNLALVAAPLLAGLWSVLGLAQRNLVKRLESEIAAAKQECSASQLEAERAQAIAANALQQLEVMRAGGPYAKAELCVPQHVAVHDTLKRIEGLIQAGREEDRTQFARMWERIEDCQSRMTAMETKVEERRHAARTAPGK